MADTVTLPGTGAVIATDDAGAGGQVQIVKLAIATDGSATLIPADSGGLLVNLGTNNDVTNGGTFAVQVDGAALTALQLLDDAVVADDAAFTPATTKLHMAGFTVDDTSTDSVDEGDAGAARMTADRRQIVQLGEAGAKDVVGGGSKTDTSDQSIMAALASNFNYLCWLTVYNSSATNTFATLKDGSTTRAIIPLPAYGGAVLNWPRGLRSTVNTAWNVASGASVTTAYFYGGGFTATS